MTPALPDERPLNPAERSAASQSLGADGEPTLERETHSGASEVDPTMALAPTNAQPAANQGKSSADPAIVPERFGRYRIEKELGRGGMGAVFLARDTQLDRRVAIKVPFFREGQDDSDAIDRFYREARAMATLHHANLCQVFDVGKFEHWHYLTMAYVDGATLSHRLKSSGPFSLRAAAQLMRTIALAVQKAHEAGIVHRDLKPSNIMLAGDGEPVIMDFGLARRTAAGEVEITHSGAVMGSPAYMSPEQVEARLDEIGPPTDIHALGVILYQLLTARRPFEGSSASIFGQIVSRDPLPPSRHRPEIPPLLDAVCLRALAKRPDQRWPSAKAFADELGLFLASGEVPAAVAPPLATTPVPAVAPAESPSSSHSPETSSTRTVRGAELRQVTVAMFSYEAGDEDASDRTSSHSERLHEQASRFAEFVGQLVRRFGGSIVDSSGQEVMACWGFPQAFEDASQRAVHASLQLLQDLGQDVARAQQLPSAAQVWITIHSGEAVAESTIGAAGGETVALVGDARNVVSRLNNVVEIGQVTISAATHQRVALFFQCESLGAQRVRGVAQPIELFKVSKPASSRNRVELIDPGNLTPLIGRDMELSILKDRWEHALEQQGQVVLLIGEAGLGKSRLVREIREHVRRDSAEADPAIIEFRCSQYQRSTGFFPAVEFLERLFDFEQVTDPAQRLDRIESYLRDLRLATHENLALLATLLSVPLDERCPTLQVSPQRQKELTEALLRNWLQRLSDQRPVLFIVEDLHWVDPTTLELLTRQVEEFGRERMLNIYTFRPEFETPWKSKPYQTQIALNRLTKRQIGEMMRKRAGGRDIPAPIVNQVAERTDGVPLFIEEFTTLILENGVLDSPDDVSLSTVTTRIPATLQDLLLARLDRMDSNPDVVHLAATIGREFSYELIAAASPLPAEQLDAELDKLVRAEVLFQKGRIPSAEYIFKHALIQDSAYNAMLKKNRQQFHQRIADVLEQRFPDVVTMQPSLLAQHYTQAGVTDKAIAYWTKAGQRSQQQSAHLEAIQQVQAGLALVKTLAESPQRDGIELSLTVPLGVSMLASRGYGNPEAGPVFDRARELAERVGDPATQFYILWGMWAWRLVRSDLGECQRLYTRLLEIAAGQSDRSWTCEAHFAPQVVHFYSGRFGQSVEHAEQAIPLFDPIRSPQHAQGTGQDVRSGVLSFYAIGLWNVGRIDQALRQARELISVSRALNHPMSMAFAFHHAAWTMIYAGQWHEALALSEEGLRQAKDQGFALWIASNTAHIGACEVRLGRVEEGLRKLQEGCEGFWATGGRCMIPFYQMLVGDGFWRAGRWDDAQAWLEKSIATAADREGLNHALAEAHRLLGELHRARRPADEAAAEQCFERAAEIARTQQSRSFELRAILSLVRLRIAQSRSGEILERLQTFVATFTEGFDTPDLVEARQRLHDMG